MPRARPKTDSLRECQGCHHRLAQVNFRLSRVYCNQCYGEVRGSVKTAVAEEVGLVDERMIDQLHAALESNDPDMPGVMKKFMDLYGGHDGLARSLAMMMARMEGRYQGGKILSHDEAEKLGVLTPAKKPALMRQCIKMLFDALSATDVFKRGGNPLDGLSVEDMEAQVAQMAWDRLGSDPRFDELVLSKIANDHTFQTRVLQMVRNDDLMMKRLADMRVVRPEVLRVEGEVALAT